VTLRRPRPTTLQSPPSKAPYAARAFLIAFGIAFSFFLFYIIYDQGYFLYYGDYNVQQIPFYQMTHDAIRAGNIGWNWYTDLGVNFIGSYSFYNLGSPFFWLTLPFPSDWVPYMMGPLLMLKIGCCGLTAYLFMSRYVKNQWFAVMGGVLYAISGYSVYNIFFNHFHEAMVFFPLLLFAMDEFMENGRRGLFALSVFFCALTNYYFFVGMVVFALIYFFLRMLTGSWTIRLADFAWLAFEAVVGFACSAFILLPSLLVVSTNPRVDSTTYGWGALLYGHEQRYMHILSSFFFPPDIPARPNFAPDAESKWASVSAWLPLFGMTGVIAWIQTKKRNWLKKLVIILMVMAFIPILNNAFQLFNSAYYARWFFMLTLVTALCTVCALEAEEVNWRRALRWSMGITAAIAAAIGLMPKSLDGEGFVEKFGLYEYPDRFWIYCAVTFASLLVLTLILPYLKRNRKQFIRYSMTAVILIGILYSGYMLGLGKSQSYDTHNFIIPYSLRGGKDNIVLPDKKNCRVDVYDPMDNQAMFWQIPTIQAFHSIVPLSTLDFYPAVGVPRGVASRPTTDHYGLRGLLSVRWLFDHADRDGEGFGSIDGDDVPKLPGFEYYNTQNGFNVWENKYYIPFGFTYDYYMTLDDFYAIDDEEESAVRELSLLHAMILNEEQWVKYQDIIEYLPDNDLTEFTEERYFSDCLERRENSGHYFEWSDSDNGGFVSRINLKKDSLVFYSVPYEEGWSATVNGKPADIEKVSIGFMAVRVPAGEENEIRFSYKTRGLLLGIIISIGSMLLLAIYLILLKFWDRETGRLTYIQELGIDPLYEVQYNEQRDMMRVYDRHLKRLADKERALFSGKPVPFSAQADPPEDAPLFQSADEPKSVWTMTEDIPPEENLSENMSDPSASPDVPAFSPPSEAENPESIGK